MRLGVFDRNRLAVVQESEVIDVTGLIGEPVSTAQGPLHHLLERGGPHGILTAEALSGAPRVDPDRITWPAPLPRPHKILGAPANYRAHVAEMNNPNTITEWGLFLKANSSVIGPGELVRLPYSDLRTDQESAGGAAER